MAVTNGNEEDKRVLTGLGTAATATKNENGQTGYGKAYTPGTSVTNAQQKMEQAQAKDPGAYQQSDAVNAAQQALLGVQAAKPQSYSSKYGQVLDNILLQIQNPQDFKYEFNGDNLFKAYADLYTQKGRQASMDAMGQAAALTGGYGNSYAQQVGNQAYDQYLLSLYDKGLDLRDRAYQKYVDDRADLYNQYNAFHTQDETDYGRYRDTVNDWKDDRNYYTDRYDTERNFDYGAYRDTVSDYRDNRDYYTGVYNNEKNFDYGVFSDQRNFDQHVQEFDESVRQYIESLNWEKMSSDQKYAAELAYQMLSVGQLPSDAILEAAGIPKEDAKKLIAALAQPTGGSSGKKPTTKKTYYTDADGNYFEFDENGVAHLVDPSKVNKDDIIDPSIGNFIYNTENKVKDAVETAKDQWNGSSLKSDIEEAKDTAKNLFSGLGSWFNNGTVSDVYIRSSDKKDEEKNKGSR